MLLFRINTNDDSVFGLTTWTLWLAHRGKARSIRRGWYLENITFSGAGEDCSPPDLLQPWGSGETCLACELGGDEVVCLTSGPRPREDPSPLTASCSSVPAIYSGGHTHSSLQPCLFCHNEDFKASALLLTPFLNLFRPRGAGFPTRSRDAWDGVGGGGDHCIRARCTQGSCAPSVVLDINPLKPSGALSPWSPEAWPVWGSQGPWDRPWASQPRPGQCPITGGSRLAVVAASNPPASCDSCGSDVVTVSVTRWDGLRSHSREGTWPAPGDAPWEVGAPVCTGLCGMALGWGVLSLGEHAEQRRKVPTRGNLKMLRAGSPRASSEGAYLLSYSLLSYTSGSSHQGLWLLTTRAPEIGECDPIALKITKKVFPLCFLQVYTCRVHRNHVWLRDLLWWPPFVSGKER